MSVDPNVPRRAEITRSRSTSNQKTPQAKVVITDLNNPAKTKKDPTKHTAYFVTVNPNVNFKENTDEMWDFAEALKETLDELLADPDELQSVLVWNTRIKGRDLDSEFAVEKGSERLFVHAHGMIVIKSFAKVNLGYKKLQQWLLSTLKRKCKERLIVQPKGLYIKCDKLDEIAESLNSRDRILEYINKNKPKEEDLDDAVPTAPKTAPKRKNTFADTPSDTIRKSKFIKKVQEPDDGDLLDLQSNDGSDSDVEIPVEIPAIPYEEEESEEEPKEEEQKTARHVKLTLPKYLYE